MGNRGQDPGPVPFMIEPLGAAEQRLSFRVGDSWCRLDTIELRSGMRLGMTACRYEPSFAFAVVQPPSELELVVSKGGVVLVQRADGKDVERGGNTLQVGRNRSPLPLTIRSGAQSTMESVSVVLSEARLCELLGSSRLPEAFSAVTESDDVYPLMSQAVTPRLLRLLDEILYADAKGASRLLWHEAKSLELLALMTDELVEAEEAGRPHLSAHDIERLERAKTYLVERLESPPTLAELARAVGLSETKLKGAFRTRFGASVFAWLRRARMEEARRLLLERRLDVTEVAQRVGYANPSKFAAAFRREHGVSPSALQGAGVGERSTRRLRG